ncbi:hypothetical protein [Streptomyces sp. NPDC048659]|uniref:hypothetical protein n=1 Tax=Streptomyces sp. NPDC048659 TaxID=3155489 RepID=UPI003429CDD4
MPTTKPQTATAKALDSFGPVQFPAALDFATWRFERALALGLIPPADIAGTRWSAAAVQAALDAKAEIWAATGTLPDMGATRAAELLTDRFGIPVDPDVLPELARKDLIPRTGYYKGHPLYDGLAIEHFTDRAALDKARHDGQLLTRDRATHYLGIRDSDFTHLTRAGLLLPAVHVRSSHQPRRAAPSVPLYRLGDLDVLLAHPAIDWHAVRATPKGHRSALARLTEPQKGLQEK